MQEENNQIVTQDNSMLAIISRAASDPTVDMAKLEKLLDMQERIMAKQAEIDFNIAYSHISKLMPRITKKGVVGYKEDKNDKKSATVEAFRFARYEDIDEIIRPILVESGFALSYNTEPRDGGGIIMHGTLSHKAGHSRVASIPLALDTSGGKNNVQAMGSTVQYGKRYALCMLLNIVTVGEDDDGMSASYIETGKAVELDMLIREFKDFEDYKPRFLKYLRANSMPEILAKDYDKALTAIKTKRAALEKAEAK